MSWLQNRLAFSGRGWGRQVDQTQCLTFHVHSGSAASATPPPHNGLASGCRARSSEFKSHSCSSLNWVHTKTLGFSVTTTEGSRDDFSKLVCVSPTIGVSTQRGRDMYQACVFRVTCHLCCHPLNHRQKLLSVAQGVLLHPACPFCWPRPGSQLRDSPSWVPIAPSCSSSVPSFCQEPPALAFFFQYPWWEVISCGQAAWIQRRKVTSLLPPTQFSDL